MVLGPVLRNSRRALCREGGHEMRAVVLCGGKGTRIRDISPEIPKPMIPIGPYPIVRHIMGIYSQHGINEFVLCLGYLGWKIKEYFLHYRYETSSFSIDFADNGHVRFYEGADVPPWRIILANTGLEAQTGCRIKRIQRYVGDETFMLTYGDGVGNVNVSELLEFHRSHGRLVTITAVRPPSRFGEMVIDDKNVVESFQEKPVVEQGDMNGGFFVCEPGVFEYVTGNESCNFEQESLQKLARDRQLMSYRHDGFWMPMDTAREYELLNHLWRTGQAEWLDSHEQADG